jgi:hypothetical protein
VSQPDLLDQLQGPPAELTHRSFRAPEPHAQASAAGQGQLEMLQGGQLVEEAGDLEGPGDPEVGDLLRRLAGDVLAAVHDRARGRLKESCQQVEECGLARTVGSDQGVNGA